MKIEIFLYPKKYVERAVQLGNISVSSKATFSEILKGLSANLSLILSDKIRSHKKSFASFLTKKVLESQKDTSYLHISRGILLHLQAGKMVYS